MAIFRTLVSVILLLCAAVISLLSFAYNHYQEDCCYRGGSTLWWAIPWTAVTAVLAILVLGSIFSPGRRTRWSGLALGLGLAMALAFASLFVIKPGD